MKDTVIFYRDWWESMDGLEAEERLAIYDAVMSYAFDGVEPTDKLTKYATALMRTAIDRDNEKYANTIAARSKAGRKGMARRWADNKIGDTVTKVTSVTNITDNVKVNDNDNVNDNDKEKTSKEVKKKAVDNNVRRFVKPTVEQVKAYCKERGNYVNAEHFCDYYESKGWKVGSAPMKDWKAAVRTWEQKEGRAPKKTPNGVRLGVGEWLDERGERRYGTGRNVVPLNAPPRPGESSYWSGETQSWVSGV